MKIPLKGLEINCRVEWVQPELWIKQDLWRYRVQKKFWNKIVVKIEDDVIAVVKVKPRGMRSLLLANKEEFLKELDKDWIRWFGIRHVIIFEDGSSRLVKARYFSVDENRIKYGDVVDGPKEFPRKKIWAIVDMTVGRPIWMRRLDEDGDNTDNNTGNRN